MSRLHHASCVVFEGVGILLRGPSGAGKSDLALRLIEAGANLVADDQVALTPKGNRLMAQAPEALAGLLEVRGLGILTLPNLPEASIGLLVDLAPNTNIARLPNLVETVIDGVGIAALTLAPFESSAVAKLRMAAQLVNGRLQPAETALGPGLNRRSA